MDADLFVDLHTLSATPIVICRHLVLQQALQAVGLYVHETTTYYEESNEMLTTIKINVPLDIRMPRLKMTVFYGDWSLTAKAAVQSACFNALAYLEEVSIITIDCIHSAELKRCRRKLLEATSWSEAFEGHAAKLQAQLTVMCKEKEQLVAKETPCVATYIATPNNLEGRSSGEPFQNSTRAARRALFLPTQTMELSAILRNRNVPLPSPNKEHAANNRKNRRLILESNRAMRKDQIGENKEQPVEPADDGFIRNTILTTSSAIQLLPLAPDKKCGARSVEDETDAADKENNP